MCHNLFDFVAAHSQQTVKRITVEDKQWSVSSCLLLWRHAWLSTLCPRRAKVCLQGDTMRGWSTSSPFPPSAIIGRLSSQRVVQLFRIKSKCQIQIYMLTPCAGACINMINFSAICHSFPSVNI